MRQIFTTLLFIFASNFLSGQSIAISNCHFGNETKCELETISFAEIKTEDQYLDSLSIYLEKKAFDAYQKQNWQCCAAFFEKSGDYFFLQKKYKKAGQSFLNSASMYDEKLNCSESALLSVNKAISASIEGKEEENVANLKKYKGLLLGKKGIFDSAKDQIKEALKIYENFENKRGIAVSYFDLANVWLFESKSDSCLFYVDKSNEIWNSYDENHQDRIFINNTLSIKAYLPKSKINKSKIEKLIEANERILEVKNIYVDNKIDFQKTCLKFYNAVKKETKILETTAKINDLEAQ